MIDDKFYFKFILPLVFHVRDQPPLQPDDGPIAIVLAPTRELVQQIHNVAQPYFNMFGIKSLCIIGGDEREKQINEIGAGKEVYICTPGRLSEFLESKITTLYRVTFIVLDEADKMLDLGFEPQVRGILADFKTPKSSRLIIDELFDFFQNDQNYFYLVNRNRPYDVKLKFRCSLQLGQNQSKS